MATSDTVGEEAVQSGAFDPPRPAQVEAYLKRCRDRVERALATLPDLALRGATLWKLVNIEYYHGHARRQIDHVECRLLRGETIP